MRAIIPTIQTWRKSWVYPNRTLVKTGFYLVFDFSKWGKTEDQTMVAVSSGPGNIPVPAGLVWSQSQFFDSLETELSSTRRDQGCRVQQAARTRYACCFFFLYFFSKYILAYHYQSQPPENECDGSFSGGYDLSLATTTPENECNSLFSGG